MEPGDPAPRRLEDVGPHRRGLRPVVIHPVAPPGRMAGRGVGAELGQVVPLRTEVVEDHVQAHPQAEGMRAVDEALERPRSPVGRMDRVEEDAVVAPVPRPGERLDRHQLHAAHPQLDQLREPGRRGVQRSFVGERPDVQLVKGQRLRRHPGPLAIGPAEGAGVEDRRGTVDVVGKGQRRRVRAHAPAGENQRIGRPRRQRREVHRPPAVLGRRERPVLAQHPHRERGDTRPPHREVVPGGRPDQPVGAQVDVAPVRKR